MNKEGKFKSLRDFFKVEPKNQEQLVQMLRKSSANNLIDVETLAMIEGVILLSQMKVRDVMLPKNQMVYITENTTYKDAVAIVNQSGHSRFPVMERTKDNVIGILHAKDLLIPQSSNSYEEEFDIMDLVRQVAFIPESKRLDSLLAEFRNNRNHMAIVVNEYGEIAGFVTLEDILEQIIGDIEDEFDIDEEAYIKIHGNRQYIIKAHTPIEEFNEQLKANFGGESYDTIGGIVTTNFGYLPRIGETINIDGFLFKILNADARRIKLLECEDKRENVEEFGKDIAHGA